MRARIKAWRPTRLTVVVDTLKNETYRQPRRTPMPRYNSRSLSGMDVFVDRFGPMPRDRSEFATCSAGCARLLHRILRFVSVENCVLRSLLQCSLGTQPNPAASISCE